jgi:glutamate/aspartate transport system permease protein
VSAWADRPVARSLIGVARTTPSRLLRGIGTAYVDLFRNVPVLVQMFLWFFVLPEVVPAEIGRWLKRDLPFPEFYSAMMCLGLYAASRVAEQVRSGIQSVPPGPVGRRQGLRSRHLAEPTATCCCRSAFASSCRRSPRNSSASSRTPRSPSPSACSRSPPPAARSRATPSRATRPFAAATALYLAISATLLFLTRRLRTRARIPGWISKEG